MTGQGIAQILVYAVVLIALAYPLGLYMARVYAPAFARRAGCPGSSAASTALVRTDRRREQDWKSYAKTVLVFSDRLLRRCSTRSSACRGTSS